MQILTDIDPSTEACPDPRTSWSRWRASGRFARIAQACFPAGGTLYGADIEGPKLTREFPVVVWRAGSDASQLDLASGLAGWLPAEVGTVVLVTGTSAHLRGHFDRRWAGAPGNLHVTVLVRETAPVEHVGLGYAILPVLALYDCARGVVTSHRRVSIKWINDILLDGAKIGGALSRGRTQGGAYTHAVFGMGLNVNVIPAVPRTVFVPHVTCLRPHTGDKPLLDTLRRLLSSFASNHSLLRRKGLAGLIDRYRKACEVPGRAVRLYEDGPGLDDRHPNGRRVLARGRVESITDELQLVIEGRAYGVGRLAYEEDCGAFGIE